MTMVARNLIPAAAWTLTCLLTIGASAFPPPEVGENEITDAPIRVLLLSGANNHDWKTTTPCISQILEGTDRFVVDVLQQTHTMTAAMLAGYDVIVSDFNTFIGRYKDPRDPGWTDATKRAYIEFVRRGGGHVVVHAGSSSFYDWPEYQELVITSFRVGQTDHGSYHAFPVRLDVPDHPITQGMSAFSTIDELWHEAPVPADATILASAFSSRASRGSGHYEPIAMVKPFGKGRSFTLLLGHDTRSMENKAFQTLLARGTEWAATGDVTLPVPEVWPGIDVNELTTSEDPLRWRRGDGTLALTESEHVIWQFNYSAKTGKPHFHPISFGKGPPLTLNGPLDHPWHHGLWFSWKLINGVNYWEEDRLTNRAEGCTSWTVARLTTEEDHTAHIEMDLTYYATEAEPVLIERRVIDISAPDPDGVFHLDWTMTFTAVQDVLLDRTPLPGEPGGKVFGGYAGLSVRFALLMRDRRVISSDGPVTFEDDRYRSRGRAMDYTGIVGDVGDVGAERAGVAILDHPENLNAPSPWYVIKGPVMSYFSPAVLCYGPHRMAADERMTLRYRVLVHGGRWDEERLMAESEQFVNEIKD
ncbi:MAG: PmoA family protein [Phycisphaerales bacterium]|nr:PmoA family protein [Phycisphaerales bacterium]